MLAILHSSVHDAESFKGSLFFTQTSAKIPGQRLRVCKLITPRWQGWSLFQISFPLFFSPPSFLSFMGTMCKNGQRNRIFNASSNAVRVRRERIHTHFHTCILKRNMHECRRGLWYYSLKTALAFAAMLIFIVFCLCSFSCLGATWIVRQRGRTGIQLISPHFLVNELLKYTQTKTDLQCKFQYPACTQVCFSNTRHRSFLWKTLYTRNTSGKFATTWSAEIVFRAAISSQRHLLFLSQQS